MDRWLLKQSKPRYASLGAFIARFVQFDTPVHLHSMRLLVALFLVSSIACGVHGRRTSSGHGSIVGTVVESRTSEPIIYGRVHLLDADMDARTDEEGLYAISNVPVGRYSLVVQCIGYPADTIRGVRVREGKATTVDVVVQDFTLSR